MDWLLDRPIAHRGLHDLEKGVPENSLAAFESARDAGYPIELDVRLLGDGNVVVFHDADLKRMTGVDASLSESTVEGVARLNLAGTSQFVPLLADALDLIMGNVPLLIEIKNFDAVGALEKSLLEQLDGYMGDFAVQSFNPLSIGWFKQNAPDIPRGQLSGELTSAPIEAVLKKSIQNLRVLPVGNPAFVGYDIRCLPFEPVARLRENGMPILGWTVKSRADENHALRFCDNVIFEGMVPAERRAE